MILIGYDGVWSVQDDGRTRTREKPLGSISLIYARRTPQALLVVYLAWSDWASSLSTLNRSDRELENKM